jgi:hypothetical protein
MKDKRTTLAAIGVALLLAALLAGCGSSSGGGDAGGSESDMGGMSMPAGEHSMNGETMQGEESMAGEASMPGMQGMAPLAPGADGTSSSADGLTLELDAPPPTAGKPETWTLRVLDADGMPVTSFERDQTKLMHLIVVRDDFTGYQHLHPVLKADGDFVVPVTLAQPGRYRVIADFTTGGKRYPLGVDVTVSGTVKRVPLPAPSSTSSVDGYTVKSTHGALRAGREEQLRFAVIRSGRPVTDLEPYLGTYGHLVALRKPDLAYSHIHPVADDRRAGTITFDAEFPTAGTYALFLQFRAEGSVRTAPFTVEVE